MTKDISDALLSDSQDDNDFAFIQHKFTSRQTKYDSDAFMFIW